MGQVDAELLDEELLDLLKGQVGEGLKYLGVSALSFLLSFEAFCGILSLLSLRPRLYSTSRER